MNLHTMLWTQPTWFEEVERWIDQGLDQQGIQRIGAIHPLRIRPWSAVLQVPTQRGQIYFKAIIPQMAYEIQLSQRLSCWHLHCILPVLASSEEQGWLLTPDGGTLLRDVIKTEADIQHWEQILPIHARLQQNSAQHLDDFVKMGLPDRRLATLPNQLQQLLANSEILALNHPDGLSLVEYQRLQQSVGLLSELCQQLAAFNIPETLHHGDLHDGNILFQNGRYLLFDWGDSSIAHPFCDLHRTDANLERLGLERNSPWWQRLRDCYLETWTEYEPAKNLETAFELAQQLAPLLAALRWLPPLSVMDAAGRSKYVAAIPALLKEFLSATQPP
jgi:Phosphotransferase enzyme family